MSGVIWKTAPEDLMASRIFSAAVVLALAMSCAILSSASASDRQRDGMRPSKHSSKHAKFDRNHKTVVPRTTDGRGFYNEPYAGYRTDAAGNSYFYYRVGADTPFGPGRGLRPPYPR
jgi:hypothetical protein